jgi:hypothetical protein
MASVGPDTVETEVNALTSLVVTTATLPRTERLRRIPAVGFFERMQPK